MFNFEKEFINKLKNLDQEAFGVFYTKTVDIFFRWTKMNYSIDKEEIEDIISSFYIKIRDNLDKHSGGSFESFVRTIFRNIIKDRFKKSESINFSDIDNNGEGEKSKFENNLVSDFDLNEFLESDYKSEFIKSAIGQLDLDSQEIIFMKFVQDMNYEQIAKAINTTEDNVRQKLSRSIKKLKDMLNYIK